MTDDEFPCGDQGDTWPSADVPVPAKDPERIGRFQIRRRLGSGGMGVVYAGRDRELSRTVAIKLLLAEHEAAGRSDRLRREAQVMARLSHPNVVPVFEVGDHDGAVFVVMEYVRGGTLGEWLEDENPPWDETLQAFLDAGRGIAAAHGAGVVHRDFKPDNVLRGRDGRVMVVDFGLARSVALRDGAGQVSSLGARARTIAPTLTGNGARIGTPAYMSPEQIRGERGDARGDQFSFAVALWEALYGEHPFGAKVWPGLAMAVVGGELHQPADPGGVPPGVKKVLERALDPNPDACWPGRRSQRRAHVGAGAHARGSSPRGPRRPGGRTAPAAGDPGRKGFANLGQVQRREEVDAWLASLPRTLPAPELAPPSEPTPKPGSQP